MSKIPEIRDIKSVLKRHFGGKFEVLDIKTKPLTAPGENYGSVMLAVDAIIKLEGKEPEDLHLVGKLCPANEMLRMLFNIQHTFKKELGMYLDAIPALEDFENEYAIKENKVSNLFAKCYGGRISLQPDSDVVDEDAVMIFENLKVAGYDTDDRIIGFDLPHTELILQNLARFHATPIALKLLKPDVFEEKVLPSLKVVRLGDITDSDMNLLTEDVIDVLRPIPEFEPYLQQITDIIHMSLTGEYKFLPARELFSTIAHFDFWVNNTMILKDESGKPIHNKIVDLQLLAYNSFAFDLLFFFYSSVIPTVLHDNFDKFIKLYYNTFINRLEQFNVDLTPFSWERFIEEVANIAPIVLGQILFMFKPIMTERGQIKDMADFDEKAFVSKDMVLPEFAERIIITVRSFIDHKWL